MTGIELIKEITSERNKAFCIPELFLDLLDNDHIAALLLNQICYWTNVKGGDWFYKTYEDWQKELRLTEYQVRTAIKNLKKYGVHTTFHKASKQNTPKLHYRVDIEQLKTALLKTLKVENPLPLNNSTLKNLEGLNIQCTEGEKFQPLEGEKITASINTEITNQENTTKITSSSSVLITPDEQVSTQVHTQEETDDDDFNSFGLSNHNTQPTPISKPPFDARAYRQAIVKNDVQRQIALNHIISLIGGINYSISQKVEDLLDDYGTEWVIAGCEQAALHGGRTLAYLTSVLDKSRKNKCKPGEKVVKEVAQPITNNNNRFWADEKKLQEMIAANGGIDDGTVKSNWKPALPRYANERKEFFASLK